MVSIIVGGGIRCGWVTLVGSRTYRNTRRFVRNVADVRHGGGCPLITTDGFKFYAPTIRHVFGLECVLAQVIKRIKRNRVVRVGTKLIVGSEWRLADALEESEDSTKLNTSFIERLNLTIRQGCAYLRRRSPCHARKRRTLDEHLELFRCFYNSVRPHSALRTGKVTRTPALQATLPTKPLSFRGVLAAHDAASRLCRSQIRCGGVSRTGRRRSMRRVVATVEGSAFPWEARATIRIHLRDRALRERLPHHAESP